MKYRIVPASGAVVFADMSLQPGKTHAARPADFTAGEAGRAIEFDGLAVSLRRLRLGIRDAGASGRYDRFIFHPVNSLEFLGRAAYYPRCFHRISTFSAAIFRTT